MKRLLLLNDTVDQHNWGSQAGVAALRHIVSEQWPGVHIDALTYRWIARRYRRAHRLLGRRVIVAGKGLSNRFSQPLNFLPVVADEFEAVADEWLDERGGPQAREFIEHLSGVEAVVLNAEGSTYRNNYTAIKELFLLWLARTRFDLPAYFLNGSVTLTRVDPILPAMVRRTFEVLDGVAVREPLSRRNIQEHYPHLPVEVVPDSAFYLGTAAARQRGHQLPVPVGAGNGQPYFCLSLPILLAKTRGFYRRSGPEAAVVQLVSRLKSLGLHAVLMAKEPGEMFVRDIARDSGARFFGPEHSYEEAMAMIGRARFLVSGRYHHLIFATMMGCPAIPLASSSHKIHGLCELLQGEIGEPIDATDLRPQLAAITTRAQAILDEREARSARLLALADDFGRQTRRLGQIVAGPSPDVGAGAATPAAEPARDAARP